MSKAKKNDIVAIEETHSMTKLNGKTTTYETLFLAKVVRADRSGFVSEYQKIGDKKPCVLDLKKFRVMTIENADKQALAKALAEKLALEPAKNRYENPKLLVDAILTGVA